MARIGEEGPRVGCFLLRAHSEAHPGDVEFRVAKHPARVAILISVHMQIAEPVFRAALQSMLEQSYPWIDIHVMCDGPQQGAVGDYLSSVHDSRLYVHQSESNRGLARSLNELIGGCLNGEYEYFARMDADDVSELDRIRRQVVFLGANSTVAVVGTACVEIDGEGNQIAHVGKPTSQAELRRRLPVLNPFVHPSVMLRAEVFRAGHRYPERWRGTCEDYALWVQLQRAGYSFANLSDPLIRFRRDRDFVHRRGGMRFAWPELLVRLEALGLPGLWSVRNLLAILGIFVIKLLPTPLLRLSYVLHRWIVSGSATRLLWRAERFIGKS